MSYKRISPIIVSEGGTGASSFTAHSLLVGEGTSALTAIGSATNGQLPIGSTGADPVLATLTAGTNIAITNGAGTISIAGTTPAAACAFFAWKKNATQTVNHGVTAVVTFDTIDINNGSVFAANVFTAPTSSKLYFFYAQISAFNTVNVGDAIGFYKNGSQIAYASNDQNSTADYFASTISVIVSLSSGDTMDIRYLNQAASGSATIGNNTDYITYFMGYQLT